MRMQLWQLFKDLSSVDNIVWANGNQPFTGRPLITLQIINTQNNNATTGSPDADGVAVIQQDTLMTLRVQYYDDNSPFSAFDAAELLLRKVEALETTRQALHTIGLAYVDTLQNVTDVPALTGTTWESRASFDIQLRTLSALNDTIGLIEHVEIAGTVNKNINVNVEV